MVKVNNELISKLEVLARLKLQVHEREDLKRDLESILKMVDKLEEIDVEGIEPLTHLLPDSQLLRSDEIKDQLPTEQALTNAPEKQSPYFKVPKVIARK
ncbi:MAG: Asp-tRNA(Asn)/Glu-tRNA(Gln) amidotransferase subunit GatC [Saprospiraceae bacterium]|nr:Asp-tRNA(Asn)/Glu-tRNA(Gln) amidotransferase subunit GatC [Saprospiraceae bacterium]